MPVRQPAGGFVTRFRAVQGAGYATAVCVLWVITFLMGAWIYIKYRIYIRIPIERAGYWKTQGFFEMKEHLVTIGLGLLPAYWYLWKNANVAGLRQRAQMGHGRAGRLLLVRFPGWPCRQQRAGVRIMRTKTMASSDKFRTFAMVFS